jgi:hypothetical protein
LTEYSTKQLVGPLPDLREKPVMLVKETRNPEFAEKAKKKLVLSDAEALQPPEPPIASAKPLPEAVMFEPRVNCVVMDRLLVTVVAEIGLVAQVVDVLKPVESKPTSTLCAIPADTKRTAEQPTAKH